MRGVVTARRPDQEDNSALPHAQALQALFTVAFAVVFHRDHREIEDGLEIGKIHLVLAQVLPTLRLVPGDHGQNVVAF